MEWANASAQRWLPRHRWFQGLAGQLHALNQLTGQSAPEGAEATELQQQQQQQQERRGIVAADAPTPMTDVRAYVESELSHPVRVGSRAAHRLGVGGELWGGLAHARHWLPPGGEAPGRVRVGGFGAPPPLRGRRRRLALPEESEEQLFARLARVDGWHGGDGGGGGGRDRPASPGTAAEGWQRQAAQAPREVHCRRVDDKAGFGVVLRCGRLTGAVVSAVVPGSDADVAGVRPGWRVLRIGVRALQLPGGAGDGARLDLVAELREALAAVATQQAAAFEFEPPPAPSLGAMHARPDNDTARDTADDEGESVVWSTQLAAAVDAAEHCAGQTLLLLEWDGGGTEHAAAAAMCRHAAAQLRDALRCCFAARPSVAGGAHAAAVLCVEADPRGVSVSSSAQSHRLAVLESGAEGKWATAACTMLGKLVAEATSPTGGTVAWSRVADEMTGYSRGTGRPRRYNARECRARWAVQFNPKRWTSLRPPRLALWWCHLPPPALAAAAAAEGGVEGGGADPPQRECIFVRRGHRCATTGRMEMEVRRVRGVAWLFRPCRGC
jgi:hypothetical protein